MFARLEGGRRDKNCVKAVTFSWIKNQDPFLEAIVLRRRRVGSASYTAGKLDQGNGTMNRALGRGAAMKIGNWAWLLAAAPLLIGFGTGCGDFWEAPGGSSSTSFALTNSGNIAISPGASTGNTVTVTVTPSSSFTGTVSLACSVTTTPSSATSPATCSLSPTSVTISGTTAQTSTLTATTTSTTTTGAYDITVTGTSGSVSETTSVCVEVTTSSGTCSSSTTSGASGVFYVLAKTSNEIVAMSISSGTLSTIGSTTLLSSNPLAIAVAPNGKFLYVSTLGGIYLYSIGSTGALTLANGGVAISPDLAFTMQVDATNSWLVEAVSGIAEVNALAINSSTGLLASAGETEQHVALPVTTVTQLAISPNDSSSCTSCYVFVGMGTGGTEIVNFNPANANPFGGTGNLPPVNSLGGANAVAVDPQNRLLYVAESDVLSSTQSGGLRVWSISSSGVTPLSGSPYAGGGTGPTAIQPSADGKYVYVANGSVSGSSTGNIASFSVTASALTSIATATAGPTGQLGLAEDSTGTYLLVVDSAGTPDLDAFTMSSGTLTSAVTGATGTDPAGAVAIAAEP